MAEERLFVRRASGLVRAFSPFDAFNFNISMCSPPQGVLWAWTWGSSMFMGAMISLSYLLGIFAVGLGAAVVYALWTIAYPRSGGEYVWLSRTVHPALGFMVNWFLTFVMWNWFALNSQTLGPYFLAPLFTALGWSDAASFVSSLLGSIVVGTIYIVLIALLLLFGSETYVKVYKWLFALTLIGSIFYIAIMLSTPRDAFIQAFNRIAAEKGMNYYSVVDTARNLGFITGWAWSATLFGLLFPFQNYSWAGFPSYIGGELRRVERAAWIGMIGGLIGMGIWYVILGQAIYWAVGYDFHSALTWLWVNHPDQYPLPFEPYPQNYLLILTDNRFIVALNAIFWLISAVYLNPPNLMIVTRNMFAWSFDRIFPTRLSRISIKYRAPIYTVLVGAIGGWLMMILVAYTTYPVMIVNTFIVMQAALLIVALASILFPYIKRDMFERWPEQAKVRVLGIPLLSISGVVMAIFAAFMIYVAVSTPALGPLQPVSLAFNIAMMLIAIPIYLAAYMYNKKQGIDLRLLFKEVPPE